MSNIFFLYVIIFGVAVGVTRASIAWARRQNILDHPNHRSSHTTATPRGGGIGIVAACAMGLLSGWYLGYIDGRSAAALASGLPIAISGYIDDRVSLSARTRLAVQIACAGVALYLLPLPALDLFGLIVPAHIAFGIYLVTTVWMTNLFNFMDGIDGIAAGQSIAIGIVWLALLGPESAFPAVLLAAAAAGFLVYNRPPAKVFMGDVGSAFCGFYVMIATLSIGPATANPWPIVWLLPAAPFILDATITLLVRLGRGKKPNVAHRSHAYQIASRRVGRHGPVSLAYFLLAVFWYGPLTYAALNNPAKLSAVLFLVATLPMVAAAIYLRAGVDD
ncbi:MraY family glycosyltransferase [Achromobacter denitrificans]|uniref:MraY family glycosyltransferase n=1 Tax=Achromobacter denitrificans TaxID=32002 RepID=UPI0012FC5C85|nr:glycosyltransferase family 4 protein [Achromobacter denitrificans]